MALSFPPTKNRPSKPTKPINFGPISPTNGSKPAKPINIKDLGFQFDYKPSKRIDTKKIEAVIVENNKEVEQMAGMFDDNSIIVDQKSNKIYSVVDGEKTVIAKNKSGEDLKKHLW